VPSSIYTKYESVFFKLILNTVKNLDDFDVKPNPDLDNAIDGAFRQNPSKHNIKMLLENEAIRGLWENRWSDFETSFANSLELKSIIRKLNPSDLAKFKQHLQRLKINLRGLLPPPFK
jgi:hypothetical protein